MFLSIVSPALIIPKISIIVNKKSIVINLKMVYNIHRIERG